MLLPDPDLVTVLSVMRSDHPSHAPVRESASLERHGDRTVIVLEDGTTIDFDADEVCAATAPVSDAPFWSHLRRAA